MARLVLVHGSVTNGQMTWSAQQALADRWELVVLDRPGFPPGPPVERVDFAEHAEWLTGQLRPDDHLCGHSYGGVVSLLAAARVEALRSLTVIEPPATAVARGNPAADAFAAGAIELWRDGPRDPDAFLRLFLRVVGSSFEPPTPLPPALEQGARTLMVERGPWEAEIPLAELRAAPFPKLVVSGAHHPAFDAICDALEDGLGAERAVLPGAGHSAQRAPGFNERLASFLQRAEQAK
ncbi:MAG TPA: alpha/beta hydrolase [Gaiellaceae bacterium]|nr:alpha/beta hydrolase [Gaiellaceae bacterium]